MIKKFSLPGYYILFNECCIFLDYKAQHPDYFYPDRVIDNFYDAPYNLIWNGGRVCRPLHNCHESMVINAYRQRKVNLRHTFTNSLINTPQLVQDWACNQYVKNYILGTNDSVTLYTPELIEHFKTNYPEIQRVYSTTLDVKDIAQTNKLLEQGMYVVNYNYNNDNDYLRQLTHPENAELLVIESCQPYCEFRKQHYLSASRMSLHLPKDEHDIQMCAYPNFPITFSQRRKMSCFISNERIEELSLMGFNDFKISGRDIPPLQWLETVTYYLALPEYRELVLEELYLIWYYQKVGNK